MSAKTKIVVLHMKELIYTLIFAGLGILLIFLLLFMFLPGKEDGESVETMRYVAGALPDAFGSVSRSSGFGCAPGFR